MYLIINIYIYLYIYICIYIYISKFSKKCYSQTNPILGMEIARSKKSFKHAIPTSKRKTMRQSAQTIIPCNHHKELRLSGSMINRERYFRNLTKNVIVIF